MMHSFLYKKVVWMMGFFFCSVLLSLSAQCPTDVTFTATITHSIGPSDGAFHISTSVVGGAATDVNYIFEATPNTTGASNPALTSQTTINNLAPGTYDLTMTAVCIADNSKVFRKTLTNLVVTGSYVQPTIVESKLVRGSFDACPTGILAVNVKNGGSTFTCTIKSAPIGVPLGLTTFSKQAGANGSHELVLTGNYPAGTYKLDIRDQYGKGRELDLTLATLKNADLPTITPPASWIHERFTPAEDCNHIFFNYWGYHSTQFSNENFKKYYESGSFEMAIAPTGETPNIWQTLITPPAHAPARRFDLTPYTLRDLHTKGLSVFVRLKDCPSISNEHKITLRKPLLQQSGSQSQCEKYGWTISYQTFSFYRLWCYPVTLTLRENDKTGPVSGTYTLNSATDQVTMPVDYNKKWYVEATDGTNTWEATTTPERFVDYEKLPFQTFCNHWRKFYNLNTFSACLPLVLKIERESDGYAQSVQTINSVTDFNYFGPNDNRSYDKVSNPLEYGVDYRIKVYKADGATLLYTAPTTIRQDAPSNELEFRLWNPSPCGKHIGSLFLRFGKNGQEPPLRDVDGKIQMSYRILDNHGREVPGRFTTNSSYDGTYFETTTASLPPGSYTLEEINRSLPEGDPCRVRLLSTTWAGMFSAQNFTYSSSIDCGKLQLRPQGNIFRQGTLYNSGQSALFAIIDGVAGGYTPNLRVKAGEVIELTQPGDYVLGIGVDYRLSLNCNLDTLHLHVPALSFEVSRPHLKAYSCKDTPSSVGHIEVKSLKGKAPITYELRAPDGITIVKSAPDDISADGVAHFVAGVTGDKFMVYAKEACGQYFLEPVTVMSAQSMRLVPTNSIRACPHIRLHLRSTYDLDTYEWKAPDGTIISTDRELYLNDVHPSQSGRYHFTTQLRHCDDKLETDIDVLIQPCEVPINPHLLSPVVH